MRRFLPALALVLGLSSPASAAYDGPSSGYGGFQGPTSSVGVTTVAKALKAWDDAPVVLTGNIVQRMAGSDDKYMFRDGTGQIVVDIDHELFWGKTVTPANTVRVSGDVDKDMFDPTKIDVKFLEVLK